VLLQDKRLRYYYSEMMFGESVAVTFVLPVSSCCVGYLKNLTTFRAQTFQHLQVLNFVFYLNINVVAY
jgi:Na+-translocating ferredoxin:NAD+ oxidoreductase RnfA subunit